MPNTREKLIELLQCSPTDIMGNRGVGALADHLIANGVTVGDKMTPTADKLSAVQKWIPVTERLPEENTGVLTYRESGINVEFRWHRGWDNDEFTPCPVTHWMPLPQPPVTTPQSACTADSSPDKGSRGGAIEEG